MKKVATIRNFPIEGLTACDDWCKGELDLCCLSTSIYSNEDRMAIDSCDYWVISSERIGLFCARN
jgi:hypothetical protein